MKFGLNMKNKEHKFSIHIINVAVELPLRIFLSHAEGR